MLNHYKAFPFRAQARMENRVTHCITQALQSPRHLIRRSASVAALSAALAASLLQPAYADQVTSQPVPPNLEVPPGKKGGPICLQAPCPPPTNVVLRASLRDGGHIGQPVPPDLEVPPGNKAFLVGYAAGTQNYVCLPAGSKFAWAFFGPQATLFNDDKKQIITHFLSPNPDEGGTPRATWQHSRDTSTVWARASASSSDPAFVASGAIPWLLLEIVGAQDGPNGGDKLSETTYIQRVKTAGGVMPTSGCTQSTDVGKKALVPYTTDYFFYKAADSD